MEFKIKKAAPISMQIGGSGGGTLIINYTTANKATVQSAINNWNSDMDYFKSEGYRYDGKIQLGVCIDA